MQIISMAWTSQAFLDGKKTVTRRRWKRCLVKPGNLMQVWDKSPRFKGKRIGTPQIIRADYEPLHDFLLHGAEEINREGGLWSSPGDYIAKFLRGTPGMIATDYVWRIEFDKVEWNGQPERTTQDG